MDLANGLRELYDLYRCGALSEEEYAAAKATVLGKPVGQQQQQQQQQQQPPLTHHPSSSSLRHSHVSASVAGGSPRHLLPRAPPDTSLPLPLPAAATAAADGCAVSDAEDAGAEDPWHNLSLGDVVSPTFSSCLTLAEQADSCIRSLVRGGDAAPESAHDADPATGLFLPPYHHAAAGSTVAASDSLLRLPSSSGALPPPPHHHHHHLASDAAATASPLFPTVAAAAATATPPPVLDGAEGPYGAGNPLLTAAQTSPLPEAAASLVREGHALLRAGDEGYRRNLHKLELLEMEVAALERRGRLDSIERTLADGVAEAARLGVSADALSREAETAAVAAGFHPPTPAAALVGDDVGFAPPPPPPPPPPPHVGAGGVGGAFNAVHAAQALDVHGFEAAALPRPPVPQPRTSVRAPGSLCSPPPTTQRTMPPMLWDVTLCRGVHVSSDLREATCVAGGSGGGGGDEGGDASGAAHVVVGTVAYDPLVVMELPERRFEWSVVLLLKSPASRDILVGVTGRGVSGTATFVLRGDGCAISEQSVEGTQLRMGYSPPLGGSSAAEGGCGSLMTTATVTCKAVNNTLHFDVNGT